MAVAQQAPDAGLALDATPGTCPCCHADVLIVIMAGEPTPVEPREIMAEYACPRCADVEARGKQRRSVCESCLGLAVLGEPLPPYGIAVADDGSAREFTRRKPIREWEAAHLLHTCGAGREDAATQSAQAVA
jgi:hypothetical protein